MEKNKYQCEILNGLGKWRADKIYEAWNLLEARNLAIENEIKDFQKCQDNGEIVDFEFQVSSGYKEYDDPQGAEYFIGISRDNSDNPYDMIYYRIYEIKGTQND